MQQNKVIGYVSFDLIQYELNMKIYEIQSAKRIFYEVSTEEVH